MIFFPSRLPVDISEAHQATTERFGVIYVRTNPVRGSASRHLAPNKVCSRLGDPPSSPEQGLLPAWRPVLKPPARLARALRTAPPASYRPCSGGIDASSKRL